ncbi:MAG: OsmC family protein [Mycetocola sp.]
MAAQHHYRVQIEWTGNRGSGTSGYRDYDRDLVLNAAGKQQILSSADAAFHGDKTRWNPEELLLAALAECHMLSYLHAAMRSGVVVVGYTDSATAAMESRSDGSGAMTEAVLYPQVTIADESMREAAETAHADAHRMCFIANSVSFPVRHVATITVADDASGVQAG